MEGITERMQEFKHLTYGIRGSTQAYWNTFKDSRMVKEKIEECSDDSHTDTSNCNQQKRAKIKVHSN